MQKAPTKNASAKLRFVQSNLKDIIALEHELADNVLSQEALLKNKNMLLVKLCQGGYVQAKDIFACQSIFTEQKTYFQALVFIKRFSIQQTEGAKEGSMESIVIKLNPNFG